MFLFYLGGLSLAVGIVSFMEQDVLEFPFIVSVFLIAAGLYLVYTRRQYLPLLFSGDDDDNKDSE